MSVSLWRPNRLLSTPLTRVLLPLPVTPNQVTVASLLAGVAAGCLFARGHYGSSVAAALVYQLACVLDNCDGEIARAKKMGSALGAWLDIATDFLTDVSVFTGIALGMSAGGWTPEVAVMWGLCLFGISAHLALVVAEKLRGFGPAEFGTPNPDGAARQGVLFKLFDSLREGEAAWLVLGFALAGKAHTLLWFGAAYLQVLWISALFMNRHWLFVKKPG